MTSHAPNPDLLAKAETLAEALPYMQRYAGQTFVVKYGGHAMGNAEAATDFAEDVVLLKAVGINPIVVHGGGPQIGAMLKAQGIESRFVDGLRVTDAPTMKTAEMVLSGAINKEIVSWISRAGGRAVGISGKDGRLVTVEKVQHPTDDLGFVGEPDDIDTRVLDTISKAGMIPVVAPIGVGPDGETYNINADTMAGALAIATGAERLFLLTDVAGVLDKQKNLIPDLTPSQIKMLRVDGTISGGMIPKLETCIDAVEGGVDAAVILDGRVPHAMLIEIFTKQGAGTLVRQG
ncbi:acetylglutamate kinase [Sphingomonas sp.]|uniref:acetylglutamate kinase n=1 Tax=Sphingomonas sp. TaxID=28214 RepID=UPI000DB8F085|nr:acetylglutamate kinase [Sphingomonas sp.]PZU11578.1 MAG: acetylglutamate kinase [Sphingomonas sp.]